MDRLYRSRTDRMFAGVAGGLAERLDADPALVRITWAVLVFVTGGFALLVYIIMAFVVPEGPPATVVPGGIVEGQAGGPAETPGTATFGAPAPAAGRPSRTGTTMVFGLALILVGGALLFERLVPAIDLGATWPVILIVLGLVIIAASVRRSG